MSKKNKRKHRKKKDDDILTYIDDNGVEHRIVNTMKVRDEQYFQHRLHTRTLIVESKKHKPPKYKHKQEEGE